MLLKSSKDSKKIEMARIVQMKMRMKKVVSLAKMKKLEVMVTYLEIRVTGI
jgi:hypothetical protein